MATPNEIRNSVQDRLNILGRGELLALSIKPVPAPESSIEWQGRFVAADKRGVVLGAWGWRDDGRVKLANIVINRNSTNDDGAAIVDGGVIERALMCEPLWWVLDNDGVARPCGIMARRVQYMAERLIGE